MNLFDRASARPPVRSSSGFNIVLGIWMLLSPFFLLFSDNSHVTWNNFLAGLLVMLLAIGRLFDPRGRRGWSWANCVLAVWLILSPFVLGFTDVAKAMWNNIIVGILVLIVAWSSAGAGRRAVG